MAKSFPFWMWLALVSYILNEASYEIHEHVADGSSDSFCGITFLFATTWFNISLHYFRFFIILAWIMLDILVDAIGVAMLLLDRVFEEKRR